MSNKVYYTSDNVYSISHRLPYYKRLKAILEAHATKEADIQLRKRILDGQKRMTYQHEYDRIRNALASPVIKRNYDRLIHEKEILENELTNMFLPANEIRRKTRQVANIDGRINFITGAKERYENRMGELEKQGVKKYDFID